MKYNKLNLDYLKLHLDAKRTGKTTLLQVGVKNYDKPFFFVCENTQKGVLDTDNNPNAVYITEQTISRTAGSNYPIIFNHDIVSGLIDRIYELEAENKFLKKTMRINLIGE